MIKYRGHKLCLCPNGCDPEELEMGIENESCHALLGIPFRYIRCGKCKFGEGNEPSSAVDKIVGVWNESVNDQATTG